MDVTMGRGARTHVREAGGGPPVLFLHGNPDTGEVWDEVVTRMADCHRCLAADLPAFGRSQAPDGFDGSLESLARWVDELHGALDVAQPVDLVVHDFGGLFGIAWAVRHPEKVRRLAILNTIFFPDYRWHFWARVWRTPILGEISFALNSRRGLALEMRRGWPDLPESYVSRTYANMTPEMSRMVLRLYRAADPRVFAPWQEGLRALVARVPCVVVWGDRDPYIDKGFAERFGARKVHHLPETGHWLQVEAPDVVADRLLAFLA